MQYGRLRALWWYLQCGESGRLHHEAPTQWCCGPNVDALILTGVCVMFSSMYRIVCPYWLADALGVLLTCLLTTDIGAQGLISGSAGHSRSAPSARPPARPALLTDRTPSAQSLWTAQMTTGCR
jgi:hypothetical protein